MSRPNAAAPVESATTMMPRFESSPYAGLAPACAAAMTWLSRRRSLGGSHGCTAIAAIAITTGRTTAR